MLPAAARCGDSSSAAVPDKVKFTPHQRQGNGDEDCNAYLAVLPQRTKNELLRVAGEKFGFITAEVEGVRYMLAADLAQRLYRHSDTSALLKLLGRYNKPLMSLRSVGHHVQHLFKQAFGLPKKAA